MVLSIIIIIGFIAIITLAIVEPLYNYKHMTQYAEDINKATVYYVKSNPAITCTINNITRTGYKKPNVTLTVTYPDKSVGELLMPLSEFENIWERID